MVVSIAQFVTPTIQIVGKLVCAPKSVLYPSHCTRNCMNFDSNKKHSLNRRVRSHSNTGGVAWPSLKKKLICFALLLELSWNGTYPYQFVLFLTPIAMNGFFSSEAMPVQKWRGNDNYNNHGNWRGSCAHERRQP